MNNTPSHAAIHEPKDLEARVTSLEELLTYVERTLQDLNEVVLEQQQRLEQLQHHAARLAADLGTIVERSAEPRRLEDDKPPHY